MNFKVGDLVLCKAHALCSKPKKYCAKLSNKWSSPLLIARFLTVVTAQLANPETGVMVKKAHVTHLMRYFRQNTGSSWFRTAAASIPYYLGLFLL
jgi:hypothetical protein